jgi:hypothetical protein
MSWRKWAFALVPTLGLVELVAHVAQTRPAAKAADWDAARDFVASQAKPEDLVVFAPKWTDPLGRMHFGPQLATLEREGRPDDTRFPRAFEVALQGGHLPELEGWRRAGAQRFGGVTVTTWENPSAAHVIEDLVSMVDPRRMRVSHGETECTWQHAGVQSGSLGYGEGIPSDRFVCPGGGFVAVSVVADLDYVPHRCIYAPAIGAAPTRIRFLDVHFGATLHGHHALYVEAERDRRGPPVTLRMRAGGNELGAVEHRDGDGWKPFELDTASLAGQVGELDVEVSGPGDRRMYCFEADAR